MDLALDGRRALVTGSSRGIGAAIARLLAQEGAAVVVHGRDEQRTNDVAAAVRADGGVASTAVGDLATADGADEVVAAALAGGPVDILVNNAGVYDQRSWMDVPPDDWADVYTTNVVSAVRMVHGLVPAMRGRGWGRVVTIGAGLAMEPAAVEPHYSAAAAARHNLAVSLARELKGTGVTSNVVAPGAIDVDTVRTLLAPVVQGQGWSGSWEENEPALTEMLFPNDAQRFGRAEEVAAAVAYLVSDHAAYVCGATLRIDGGVVHSAF